MTDGATLESLIRRDRLWVAIGALATTVLAWTYLIRMAQGMATMESMGNALLMAHAMRGTPTDFFMMFVMWAIMMVAMMLPSAVPMLLIFAMVNRRRKSRERTATSPATFATGYFAAWTAFSLAATVLQWGLHTAGVLSPMMATTSAILGGTTLVAAGVYQWTPLKTSCLRHCQSPLQFISTHWRDGRWGAFRMGWHHGRYCLGCCWILMCLLFVGGVMNLLWIAGLALFVLLEKIWPYRWIPAASGAALVGWGMLVVVAEL